MGILMSVMRLRLSKIACIFGVVTGALLTIGSASGEEAKTAPLKIASLMEDGKAIPPGDLLRTTRIFPNWNLNCEVILSQGRHLCAVELRSLDAQGRQVFSWSIALAADGTPIIIFKVPADVSQSYGLRMTIGPFTTILTPRREDCNPSECRIVAPFETALRTLMVSQQKIIFSLLHNGQVLQIEAPLAGLSEALETARRDPIGLLAVQRPPSAPVSTPKPPTKPKRVGAAGDASRKTAAAVQ